VADVDIHAVAAEASAEGLVGDLQLRLGGVHGRAEGLVHELCHAAVFGLSAADGWHYGCDLNEAVSLEFEFYEDHLAADRSECAALAVEREVLRALGWPVDVGKIVKSSYRNLRVMGRPEMDSAIERAGACKVTQVRARRVVRWLAAIGRSPAKGRGRRG